MCIIYVNEKPLHIVDYSVSVKADEKFLLYDGYNGIFDEAVDILFHTLNRAVFLYTANIIQTMEELKLHFKTIEAAGGRVKNSTGSILFIFRFDKWDLPKGKIEKNENVQSAAKREIFEECGLPESSLHFESFVKKTYHIYQDKKPILKIVHWFDFSYDGNDVLYPQNEEGITKVEWKNKQEIQHAIKNTYQNIKSLF